ncbi:MAG: methyltransferase domain-containing protein [Chloroflexota bacterium]|nr:methyltransferase domain-containing protein [Chloroflexota bacterium]
MTGFRLPLRLRADAVEMLDAPSLEPHDVERNLADLARLNRLPGGAGTSAHAIDRLLDGRRHARILDAGAGRGDMPLAFARRGWEVTAFDTHPGVLGVARRVTGGEPRITVVEADARSLPFDDGAYHVAHCSLLLHHLDPGDAAKVLREMRRVSRAGVVVNDLRRGVLPFVATAATVLALGRSHVTRNDGLLSARRAYTLDELDELLDGAGLAVRWRSPGWMPRVVTAASPR